MRGMSAFIRFSFQVQGLSSTTWVHSVEGIEAVSDLFRFDLGLTSEDGDIAFADVVGKPAVLTFEAADLPVRHVHGIVSRFTLGEEGNLSTLYQARLVPKLWRLQHRHDSRIFQEMTAPDILQKVLQAAGLASDDYRLALCGSYRMREYCVQYHESDFAFINRLMEEEGIYYFFEHSADAHVMVIADAPSASVPIPGLPRVPLRGNLPATAISDSVSRFLVGEEVRPGKVSLTDYNFQKPSLSLAAGKQATQDTDLEIYEYPGNYALPAEGTALATVRIEQCQALKQTASGESGCARFAPGFCFTLSDHPRDDANQEYLLTRVRHSGRQTQVGVTSSEGAEAYQNSFDCIPSAVPCRPERRTPRPTIRGIQTAIVTGPQGEEIYTDEHGRVKVHFHWDREGKLDETSSCWLRVSQIWAGSSWGAMFIPRIGHEVVVDFIEGDPDRPLVVGSVYHATNIPPYALPDERTKSTIKSNSSLGGEGFNEIRFEDKKGEEEIFVHGQKDLNSVIENDKTTHVKHDHGEKVDNDQTIEVGKNLDLTVGKNRTERIEDNDDLSVGKNKTVSVEGNYDLSVTKDKTETVEGSSTESVTKDKSVSVSKNYTTSVDKDLSLTVSKNMSETVTKDRTSEVNENYTITVSKDMKLTVSKNLAENISEKRTIVVGKKLSVQCGDATITVESNGNVTVKAKKLVVKSDGAVSVEASGNVKVKGSKVAVN